MTDKAMAEYLLRIYIENRAKAADERKKNNDLIYAYYDGRADLACMILYDKFDMITDETDTEYIARNADFSVTVKKEEVTQ